MPLVSVPMPPPPPEGLQVYGLGNLKLFHGYSRAEYEAAFGVQAAEFDPLRPVKSWLDTTVVPGTVVTYRSVGLGPDQKPAYIEFKLPAEIASSVNLPGSKHYAAYAPAPTAATQFGYLGTPIPLDPVRLASPADAARLQKLLGGTLREYASQRAPITYPVTETRRWYVLNIQGKDLDVGYLLWQENSAGVGAPGDWQGVGTSDPHFVPKTVPPSSPDNGLPEVSYPMRDLNVSGLVNPPDERFILTGPGGGVIEIVRGALAIDAPAQVAGDGFAAADRTVLGDIKTLAQNILGKI